LAQDSARLSADLAPHPDVRHENSGTRHVNGDELLFAAGLLIFGVVLPGVPFLKLLENRKS
jgi:hypothetical protein